MVGTYDTYSDTSGSTSVYGPDVIMKTSSYGTEVSWIIKYGSTTICSGSGYSSSTYNAADCSLTAGTSYTATCYDSYNDGWHGGYLLVGANKVCDETTAFSSKSESFTYAARTSFDETNTGIEKGCLGVKSGGGDTDFRLAITGYPTVDATYIDGSAVFNGAATDCSINQCITDYY